MITVVGMGPGNPDYLTQAATSAIKNAAILVGGKRHLANFPDFKGETQAIGTDIEGLLAWMHERLSQQIVVLASGDPLFYGIGKRILARFSFDQVQIVPGISSVQYLCSKTGVDMNDIYLTSSHGRVPDFDWLLAHPKIAMVTDNIISPRQIADEIIARGQKRRMLIGENLSQINEQIRWVAPEDVAHNYAMNVVIIENER